MQNSLKIYKIKNNLQVASKKLSKFLVEKCGVQMESRVVGNIPSPKDLRDDVKAHDELNDH